MTGESHDVALVARRFWIRRVFVGRKSVSNDNDAEQGAPGVGSASLNLMAVGPSLGRLSSAAGLLVSHVSSFWCRPMQVLVRPSPL